MSEVASLARRLQDDRIDERAEAAEMLCQLGEEAREAAVELVRASGDAEAVSQWAVAALEELGPPPMQSVGALAVLVSHDAEPVAYWAVTLLGRRGADADSAAAALVQALESSAHLSVQQRAAWALGKISTASAEVKAALDRAVQTEDPRLARLATQAREQLET